MRQPQGSLSSGKDKIHHPSFHPCHLWSFLSSLLYLDFWICSSRYLFISQNRIQQLERILGVWVGESHLFFKHVIPTTICVVSSEVCSLCFGCRSVQILILECLLHTSHCVDEWQKAQVLLSERRSRHTPNSFSAEKQIKSKWYKQ